MSKCDCVTCLCLKTDDYTQENWTCEDCFRDCLTTEGSISWGELAELTHATQVERFGWCICEGTNGEGQLAEDCPKEGV